MVERRRAPGRGLRGGHAPARRPEDGLALRAVHRSGAECRGHHARRKAARGTRRHRARRSHRVDPARNPGAVPARSAVAAGDVPRARPLARCARGGIRATRQARVERRLLAGGLGHWLACRPAPQRQLLEQCGDQGRTSPLRTHRRRGHRTAAVPRGATRRHVRRARAAVPVDQAEPAGRAARRATTQRLLLRLQPDAAPVQGQPTAAPRPVAGDRPRQADHGGDGRG